MQISHGARAVCVAVTIGGLGLSLSLAPLGSSRVAYAIASVAPAQPTVVATAATVELLLENGAIYQSLSPDGSTLMSVAVVDDALAPMWTVYEQLGGVAVLGYPAEDHYTVDGSSQVFQVFGDTIVGYDTSTGAYIRGANRVRAGGSRLGARGWRLDV